MKFILPFIFAGALLAQDNGSPAAPDSPELNVNSRYTVESVQLSRTPRSRLSSALLEDMQRLIGQHLSSDALDHVAHRISHELRDRAVSFRVARGFEPQTVKVMFDVDQPLVDVDLVVPEIVYDSKLGWTGETKAVLAVRNNLLTFSALTDNEDQVERFSGIKARFERSLGTREGIAMEVDSFQTSYNPATSEAALTPAVSNLSSGGLMRSWVTIEPSFTLHVTEPLTLTVGFDVTDIKFPNATSELVDALAANLRYRRSWEDSRDNQFGLDASYSMQASSSWMGSEAPYTRHFVKVKYTVHNGRQMADASAGAGIIYGNAPLMERFVLGTSSELRGWNKFDLAPLGGARVVYGSLEYGYRMLRVFYDVGSIWDKGTNAEARQSVGVGIGKDALLLALAFPMREGQVVPVLVAGMNF